MRQYNSDLHTLATHSRRLQLLRDQLDVFHGPSKDYPPQTRPFKSSSAFAELELEWSASSGSPKLLTIEIPQGSSMREAGRLIHHTAASWWKGIEVEAQTAAYDKA